MAGSCDHGNAMEFMGVYVVSFEILLWYTLCVNDFVILFFTGVISQIDQSAQKYCYWKPLALIARSGLFVGIIRAPPLSKRFRSKQQTRYLRLLQHVVRQIQIIIEHARWQCKSFLVETANLLLYAVNTGVYRSNRAVWSYRNLLNQIVYLSIIPVSICEIANFCYVHVLFA